MELCVPHEDAVIICTYLHVQKNINFDNWEGNVSTLLSSYFLRDLLKYPNTDLHEYMLSDSLRAVVACTNNTPYAIIFNTDLWEWISPIISYIQTQADTLEGSADSILEPFSTDEHCYYASTEETDNVIFQYYDMGSRPLIEENKKSIDNSEITSRFKDAGWFDLIKTKNVTIAGLGGIGSYTAFLLSRLHVNNIILFDDDFVETANMSGQLYGRNMIAQSKVSAVSDFINIMSSYYSIYGSTSRVDRTTDIGTIVFCGFDNMTARKDAFLAWKTLIEGKTLEERKKCLFVDGRLAAEEFQVYAITGDSEYNIGKYEEEALFSDNEADETICSYKQTSYSANMIGCIMVNIFINFVANEVIGAYGREVPYFTTYNGFTMQLELK